MTISSTNDVTFANPQAKERIRTTIAGAGTLSDEHVKSLFGSDAILTSPQREAIAKKANS